MKRLLAMLLALTMVLSMIPMTAMPAFAQEYLIQEETLPEETIPEETIPEETVPEETIPEETIPEETIPEETRPEEIIPEETIPEETIPEETLPEETLPEETVPEETIPEETIPTRSDTEVTVTASGTCGDNLTWELTSDGTLTISGTGEMTDYNSFYSSMQPPWSNYRRKIINVVVENGVTYIGSDAFYWCSALTTVSIPNTVTKIGSEAFEDCSSLTSIIIPEGVTHIGSAAFDWCSDLSTITISSSVISIGESAFANCNSLQDVYISDPVAWCKIKFGSVKANPMEIADNLHILDEFGNEMTEIVLDPSVTKIPSYAFFKCSGLTSVTLPETVKSIGAFAFYGCTGLSLIAIPNSVTAIGKSAFSGCTNLTSVNIPINATTIEESSFAGCAGLSTIVIPKGVTSIGATAFSNCTNLTTITIPDTVSSISNDAFKNCVSLTAFLVDEENPNYCNDEEGVLYTKDMTTLFLCPGGRTGEFVVPDSVTTIGKNAFSGCASLTSVIVPNTVKYINVGAFYGCKSLESLTIPFVGPSIKTEWETYQYPFGNIFGVSSYSGSVEVRQIYYGSSTGSTQSATYYIPASLKSVKVTGGNILCGAFYNCSMLTSIILPDNIKAIGEYAFTGCSGLTEITIPDTVTKMPGNAFISCSALEAIRIGENNPAFCCDENGVVYNKDMTKLVRCIGAYSGVFNIPETVTAIDAYAFAGCKNITDIHIPDSVTEIGGYAFLDCVGLTEVVVPDSVQTVGESAFYRCKNLVKATLSGSISKYAFRDCSALKEVVMTDNVTHVDQEVFRDCKALKEIQFFGDAPTIDWNAFNLLTVTIYYPSGNTTWDSIVSRNLTNARVTWKARVNKGSCGDSVQWILDTDNTLTISGTGAMYDYAGGDQPWAEHQDFITDVVISSGVTSIGANTFRGYGAIKTVSISETVTAIGAYAFGDAEIGKITFIGDAPAFDANSFSGAAAYITYPSGKATWEAVAGNHYGGTLIWCPDGKVPTLPSPAVKEVVASGTFDDNGKWAVYNDGLLEITAAGDGDASMSFESAPWYDYRTQIWEVHIGGGITSVENGDLSDLPLVTTVVIGASVKNLGSKAFSGATRNLRHVWFENDAPEIFRDAFRGVTASIHFKTIYPGWENAAFNNYRGTLTWVPHTEFSSCGADLTWVLEGDTLTIDGLGDMYDYTGADQPWSDFVDSIATVVVENGVTGIGSYAFAGLPDGVKVIFRGAGPSFGENAFSGVTATAYYPVEKNNWTEEVMGQHGGTVTWVGYDKNMIPTFEKNENATYLSQSAAADVINSHLLSRDTEFTVYVYQNFYASTTEAQLMKVGETLLQAAFGQTDRPDDMEYLDSHFVACTYELTYGHDGQKYYLNIHYKASYLTTAEQEIQVDNKVQSILKSLDLKGESDYKKIQGIYNYLIKNVNYDDTLAEEADLLKYTAYGALVNRKANSHGFAVAFYRLALELGLHSNIVRGNLTGHLDYDAWNIVFLNGYYYHVDAAQDAIRYDAGKSKAYFLKGTDYMEGHTLDPIYMEAYDEYCSPINYRSDAVLVGRCGDAVYWAIFKDNTLRIMGEGEMKGSQGYRQYYEYVDKVIIEEGVTDLVGSAFENFFYLKSVKLPNSLTYIGSYAFDYCESLKSVKIPSSVEYIADYAFNYCRALTEITIPGSVTFIGKSAFEGCSKLKTVTLKEGLKTIGAEAFSGTKISKITLPSTVTTIGEAAFSNCESLTSITIPQNVTQLGNDAFRGCSKLASAKIKSSKLTKIPYDCFSACSKLTSITIPASVKIIEASAFEYCWKLTSVIIEGSVLTIGDSAFEKCGLKTIVFRGDAPEYVHTGAFVVDDCTLYYPGDNETWTEDALFRIKGGLTKKEIPCTLGQVKNLKISSVSDSSVKIAYSKVKNAAKYEIYVDGKLYDTTTSTSYTFKDLPGGIDYDVHVMAVKTSGGVVYCGAVSQTIQIRPYYDLSGYNMTLEYTSSICDGTAKAPTVTVKKNSSAEPLVRNTDYTVTYEDNIAVGTATVTVTGINAYGGEIVKTFKILPDKVTGLKAEVTSGTGVTLTYDAVPGATEYWIYHSGERAAKTSQTTYTLTGLKAGKTYEFTVKAVGKADGKDYAGEESDAVSAIPFMTAQLSEYEFAYTGKSHKPGVTVYGYNGEVLTEGVDYTLSYKNNKNTGKGYVEIKGKGNYSGSVKEYFVINPAQVTGLKVSSTTKNSVKISYTKASSNSTKYYNVYVNGEKVGRTTSSSYTIKNLTLGEIYSVYVVGEKTVSGTTYYGEASEVITVWPGTYIGGYKATLEYTKATYTGEEFRPAVTVKTSSKSSAKTLVEGTDYIVTYENNADPGKAKVVIQGIGSYAGAITKTVTINPPKVTNVTATAVSKTSIEVSFDAAPGATEYWIYVNGSRKAKVTDTSCVITGLKKNKTYKITVKAVAIVDGTNYTSDYTDAVSCKTLR